MMSSLDHVLQVSFVYVYLIDYSIIVYVLHQVAQLPLSSGIRIRSFKALLMSVILIHSIIVLLLHSSPATSPAIFIDFLSESTKQTSVPYLLLTDLVICLLQIVYLMMVRTKQRLDGESMLESSLSSETSSRISPIPSESSSRTSSESQHTTTSQPPGNSTQERASSAGARERLNSEQIRRLRHFLRNYRLFMGHQSDTQVPSMHDTATHAPTTNGERPIPSTSYAIQSENEDETSSSSHMHRYSVDAPSNGLETNLLLPQISEGVFQIPPNDPFAIQYLDVNVLHELTETWHEEIPRLGPNASTDEDNRLPDLNNLGGNSRNLPV